MDDNDFDIEAFVKTASYLSADAREQFMALLPEAMRLQVVDRLAADHDQTLPIDESQRTIVNAAKTRNDDSLAEESSDDKTIVGSALEDSVDTTVERPSGAASVAEADTDSHRTLDASEQPQAATHASGTLPSGTLPSGTRPNDTRPNETQRDSTRANKTRAIEGRPSEKQPSTIVDGDRQPESSSIPGAPIRLVRKHARGAIGEVYVAYDEQLSREVALKRIRSELPPSERRRKRFIREAIITAKLQHPGIVPIYGLDEEGSTTHYTMPLISGSTLSRLIKQTHRGIVGRSITAAVDVKDPPVTDAFHRGVQRDRLCA